MVIATISTIGNWAAFQLSFRAHQQCRCAFSLCQHSEWSHNWIYKHINVAVCWEVKERKESECLQSIVSNRHHWNIIHLEGRESKVNWARPQAVQGTKEKRRQVQVAQCQLAKWQLPSLCVWAPVETVSVWSSACVQLLAELGTLFPQLKKWEYGPLEQVASQADILFLFKLILTAILVTNSGEAAHRRHCQHCSIAAAFFSISISLSHSLIMLFSLTRIAHLHTLPFILCCHHSGISSAVFVSLSLHSTIHGSCMCMCGLFLSCPLNWHLALSCFLLSLSSLSVGTFLSSANVECFKSATSPRMNDKRKHTHTNRHILHLPQAVKMKIKWSTLTCLLLHFSTLFVFICHFNLLNL